MVRLAAVPEGRKGTAGGRSRGKLVEGGGNREINSLIFFLSLGRKHEIKKKSNKKKYLYIYQTKVILSFKK